jgi:hypothetical protein
MPDSVAYHILHNSLYLILVDIYRYIKTIEAGKQAGYGEVARKYFEENSQRVENVVSTLADTESGITYLQMIRFRQRVDFRGFRFHGGESRQYFKNDFFRYPQSGESELLIDCGGFDGFNAKVFLSMFASPPPHCHLRA